MILNIISLILIANFIDREFKVELHSGITMLLSGTLILALVRLDVVSGTDNYPVYRYTRKPCCRMKNTINFQGELCNEAQPATVDNCVKLLKATCPEYNHAECIKSWPLKFPNNSSKERCIPACHLRYKTQNTWAESYYANFDDEADRPDKPSWDIVEVRRAIFEPDHFGNRDLGDWPETVVNPMDPRGLTWTSVPLSTLKIPLSPAVTDMRSDPEVCTVKDENSVITSLDAARCEAFANYLRDAYPAGFEPEKCKIPLTTLETTWLASITTEYPARCMYVQVRDGPKKIRKNACQVLYVRHASLNYTDCTNASYASPMIRHHDTSFEYLEVQMYFMKEITIRYAHWNVDTPEDRDQIFSNDGRVASC